MEPNAFMYLIVAAVMFSIGVIGVLTRRNGIVVFMCVELMLNAVNLSLITFSKMHSVAAAAGGAAANVNPAAGSMMVFFVMCVAAAEAVVGLAIVISIFRNKLHIDINDINIFKW